MMIWSFIQKLHGGHLREGHPSKIMCLTRGFSRIISKVTSKKNVHFSDRVYLRIRNSKVTLVSLGIDNVQAMNISISQARAIVRSIKMACKLQDIQEIKIGDLWWKTDGRVQAHDEDKLLLEFSGPLGFAHEEVTRKAVFAGLDQFAKIFGLDE